MNKLLAMATFVRVAESGGFTAAAAQLGLSVSAVAKAVDRLEQDLGVQLLARSTRKLALNDSGREFYARCVRVLNDIEDAESTLRGARETPRGRLRMALPILFGRLTFFPRIAEFNVRYPDVVLDVSLDDRPADPIERGLDLAVRVGELNDSRYVARMLNRGLRITGASPAYIKRHGEPRTPQELAGHNCIVGTSDPVWPFNVAGRRLDIAVKGNLVVTGGDALREAALLGLGIAQSNWWTFHHDIVAGSVKPLLADYAVEGRPISVVYPPTRHVPRKLRVMIDFLVEITQVPAAEERKLGGSSTRGRTTAATRR